MPILTIILAFAGLAAAKPAEIPECATIVKACEAKQFKIELPGPGKNLWSDCVAKRAADKPVEGVDAPAADAKKCLEAVKASYKGHGH